VVATIAGRKPEKSERRTLMAKTVSTSYVLVLNLIASTCMSAARLVLPLYALTMGARPATVGLLAATFSFFPMLLAVAMGRLNDRFGSRWLMTGGAIVNGVGMLLPFLLPNLATLFFAGIMSGLATVMTNLSTQNLVGLLSNEKNRPRNFSNYALTNSGADLIAPLIAGFSIDHWGHGIACLELALLGIAPVVMLIGWGHGLPRGTRRTARAEGGVKAMLAVPGVRQTLVTGSLINCGLNLFTFYMPVYTHSIGLSASLIGIVQAMYSSAAFVVRVFLAQLVARFRAEGVLAYAFYFGAGALMLVPLFKGAFMLGLLSFIFGLGMGCGQPVVTMLMFTSSTDGRSGEALGLKVTVNHITKLLSPIVFGAIASALGLPAMFWLNAALMGTGGIVARPRGERSAVAATRN
jgi:MFS family permease